MKTVLVSGCYDIIHAGHCQFFRDAKALGDKLIVCIAGDDVYRQHKKAQPAIPAIHKAGVIADIRWVDEVRITQAGKLGLDFESDFWEIRPDVLVVTEDDRYAEEKKALCQKAGCQYVQLAKALDFDPISTTEIRRRLAIPLKLPLRVDFAGGWLDVPCLAVAGAYIVNCAISPLITTDNWPYQLESGVGGSAAWAMLEGRNSLDSEIGAGVGWQDPAVIAETGLCVWESGHRPKLVFKDSGDLLARRMALVWTDGQHNTATLADRARDYAAIVAAGAQAARAVREQSVTGLMDAVEMSYKAQLDEGMAELPAHERAARKYCGSGHGGYALYLFSLHADREAFLEEHGEAKPIEPYLRESI